MVFVRKIKDYYVLGHSVREKNRVIQKTRYIGKSLPPKHRLEQLQREFLKEIMGERYRFFSGKEVKEIEDKRKEYKKETKKLSPLEKKKRLDDFMIRFTYDSSKLSGVDVTLRQTFLILKDGIIPKGFKNLKTMKEIENHEKGVVAITMHKGILDLRFIKKLHKV